VRSALVTSLALSLAASGCASLTGTRTEPYMIYSTPQGATVMVNGVPIGTTPVTVMVDKQRAPQVALSMPGYPPQSCYPRLSPGTGYVVADSLLCLFLFPIGCIAFIDAGGAWNELEVNSCSVYFQPQQGAPYEAPPPPPAYPPPPGGADAPPPPPPPAPL
jgi:hypothetical protein